MAQFISLTSRVVVVPQNDIDTDQIIPARFLKTTDKHGLGASLFADWRYGPDGVPVPGFPLNAPRAPGRQGPARRRQLRLRQLPGARALGAHRLRLPGRGEHLVRRHLPEQRAQERPPARGHRRGRPCLAALAELARQPDAEVTVDLATQTLRLPDGTVVKFPIDPFARTCLLEGVDELGYILRFESRIEEHEQRLREGA